MLDEKEENKLLESIGLLGGSLLTNDVIEEKTDAEEDGENPIKKIKLSSSSNENPVFIFKMLFDKCFHSLMDKTWYIRHGACLGIKALMKSSVLIFLSEIQLNIKECKGIESKEIIKSLLQSTISIEGNLNSLLQNCLILLAIDRFSDYLFEKSYIIVRELACELIVQILSKKACKENDKSNRLMIVMKFLIEMLESNNWQILQGGLYLTNCLVQKYPEIFKQPVENLIISKFSFHVKQNEEVQIQLWNIISIFISINDDSENSFERKIKNFEAILWSTLKDHDEISFSSFGILEILLKIHLKNVSTFKISIDLLLILLKYFLHSLKSVRKMAESLFLRAVSSTKFPYSYEMFNTIIQSFIYEQDLELKKYLKDILHEIITTNQDNLLEREICNRIMELAQYTDIENMITSFHFHKSEEDFLEASNPYFAIYPLPESSAEKLLLCEINFDWMIDLLTDIFQKNPQFKETLNDVLSKQPSSDHLCINILSLLKLHIQNKIPEAQYYSEEKLFQILNFENKDSFRDDIMFMLEICDKIIVNLNQFIIKNSKIKWDCKKIIKEYVDYFSIDNDNEIIRTSKKIEFLPKIFTKLTNDNLLIEKDFKELTYFRSTIHDLLAKIKLIAERTSTLILQGKVLASSIIINNAQIEGKKIEKLNLLIKPLVSAMNKNLTQNYSKITATALRNLLIHCDNPTLSMKVLKNSMSYLVESKEKLDTFGILFDFEEIDTLSLIRDLNETNFFFEILKDIGINTFKGLLKVISHLTLNSKYIENFNDFPEKLTNIYTSILKDKEKLPIGLEIISILEKLLMTSIKRENYPLFSNIYEQICKSFESEDDLYLRIIKNVIEENVSIAIELSPFLIQKVLRLITSLNFSSRKFAIEIFPTLLSLIYINKETIPLWLKGKSIEPDYQSGLTFFTTFRNPKDYIYKPKIFPKINFRSYQEEGIKWLDFLYENSLPGCLCDEMGLGKTIQILTIIQDKLFNTNEKCLIICPSTVVYHWISEINKFLDPEIIKAVAYEKNNDIRNFNVIITSYNNILKSYIELEKHQFLITVLDEGHLIKNPKTKIAKAVKEIRSRHKFVLTGTPIQNSVAELWGIFDFLFPGYLGDENIFKKKFTKHLSASIVKFNDNSLIFSTEQEKLLQELHRKVLPFIMRREKKDVLKDLPPKIIQDYYCNSSKLQTQLLDEYDINEFEDSQKSADKEDLPKNTLQVEILLLRN